MARRDSAAVIAEIARERQIAQLQSIDGLDTKAASLLGFAGVVLTLEFTSTVADHWNKGMAVGAGVLIVAIIVLAVALIPRKYKANPSIIPLAAAYMDVEPAETLEVVVDSIARGMRANAEISRRKALLVKVGIGLVAAGISLSGGGLLYSVQKGDVGGGHNQGHSGGVSGPRSGVIGP